MIPLSVIEQTIKLFDRQEAKQAKDDMKKEMDGCPDAVKDDSAKLEEFP